MLQLSSSTDYYCYDCTYTDSVKMKYQLLLCDNNMYMGLLLAHQYDFNLSSSFTGFSGFPVLSSVVGHVPTKISALGYSNHRNGHDTVTLVKQLLGQGGLFENYICELVISRIICTNQNLKDVTHCMVLTIKIPLKQYLRQNQPSKLEMKETCLKVKMILCFIIFFTC